MLRSIILSAALAVSASATFADTLVVRDAFARASSPNAQAGAVFLVIENSGAAEDRLVAAQSDVAARSELHTHVMSTDGIARMVEVKDGFAVPAGGSHALKRGGDHVMLMGLNRSFVEGESIPLTLEFASGVVLELDVPIVMDPGHGAHGAHHGG